MQSGDLYIDKINSINQSIEQLKKRYSVLYIGRSSKDSLLNRVGYHRKNSYNDMYILYESRKDYIIKALEDLFIHEF
ncbi:MAG: hypothetical protein KF690_11735, partial [Bacteroidetes bacterium]|nr:hypothetical protein [Bacteroidota bacterium]